MYFIKFGIVSIACDDDTSSVLNASLQRAIKEARETYRTGQVQVISHSLLARANGTFLLTVTVGYN